MSESEPIRVGPPYPGDVDSTALDTPAADTPRDQAESSSQESDRKVRLERNGRVTVIWGAYLEQPGVGIHPVEGRYAYNPLSEEQPWHRIIVVGEQWQPVEKGWLTSPSLIAITNKEGEGLTHIPTREAIEEMGLKVIEVGTLPVNPAHRTMRSPLNEPTVFAYIVPGQASQWHPADLSLYRIRCRKGKVRCVIDLFP